VDSVTVDLKTRLARVVAVRGTNVGLDSLNQAFRKANQPFRATVVRERDF